MLLQTYFRMCLYFISLSYLFIQYGVQCYSGTIDINYIVKKKSRTYFESSHAVLEWHEDE